MFLDDLIEQGPPILEPLLTSMDSLIQAGPPSLDMQKLIEAGPPAVPESIGIIEQAGRIDWAARLPFSPKGLTDAVDLYIATQRLTKNNYEEYAQIKEPTFAEKFAGIQAGMPLKPKVFSPKQLRQWDVEKVEDYLLRMEEESKRGKTFWAQVLEQGSYLPGWMMEFVATGGIASLGRPAAKTAATKLLKGAVEAVARTAAMPHRVGEAILKRQIPEEMHFGKDDKFVVDVEPDSWATSIAKGWGEVFIEVASESTGGAITKAPKWLMSKTKFGNKLLSGLRKAYLKANPTNKTADFFRKISTQAGYSDLIGEMGEERLATILHAIANTEDFGAGKDASWWERLKTGLSQDVELNSLVVEGIVLSLPAGARVGLSRVVSPFRQETHEARREAAFAKQAQKEAREEVPAALMEKIIRAGKEGKPEVTEAAKPEVTEAAKPEAKPVWKEPYNLTVGRRWLGRLNRLKKELSIADLSETPQGRALLEPGETAKRPAQMVRGDIADAERSIIELVERLPVHVTTEAAEGASPLFRTLLQTAKDIQELRDRRTRIGIREIPVGRELVGPGALLPSEEREGARAFDTRINALERNLLTRFEQYVMEPLPTIGPAAARVEVPGKVTEELIAEPPAAGVPEEIPELVPPDLAPIGERVEEEIAVSGAPRAPISEGVGVTIPPKEIVAPEPSESIVEEMQRKAGLDEEAEGQWDRPAPSRIVSPTTMAQALSISDVDLPSARIIELGKERPFTEFREAVITASGLPEAQFFEHIGEFEPTKVWNWINNAVAREFVDVNVAIPRDPSASPIVTLTEHTGKDLATGRNISPYKQSSLMDETLDNVVYFQFYHKPTEPLTGIPIGTAHYDFRSAPRAAYTALYDKLLETGQVLFTGLSDSGTLVALKINQQGNAAAYIQKLRADGVEVLPELETAIQSWEPTKVAAEWTMHEASKKLFGPNYHTYSPQDLVKRARGFAGEGATLRSDLFPDGIAFQIRADTPYTEHPDHPYEDGAGFVTLEVAKKMSESFSGDPELHRGFKLWVNVREGDRTLLEKIYFSVAPKDFDMQGAEMVAFESASKRYDGYGLDVSYTIGAEDVRIKFGDHPQAESTYASFLRQTFNDAVGEEVQEALYQEVVLPTVEEFNTLMESAKDPLKAAKLLQRRLGKGLDVNREGDRLAWAGLALHPGNREYFEQILAGEIYERTLSFHRKNSSRATLVPATGAYREQLAMETGDVVPGILLPYTAKRTVKKGDLVLANRSPIVGVSGTVAAQVRGFLPQNMGQIALLPHNVVVENFNGDYDADEVFIHTKLSKTLTDYYQDHFDDYKDIAASLTPVESLKEESWLDPEDRLEASWRFGAGKPVIGQVSNLKALYRILQDNQVQLGSAKLISEEQAQENFIRWSAASTDPKLGLLQHWGWFTPWGAKEQLGGRDRIVAQMFGLADVNWETGEWKIKPGAEAKVRGLSRAIDKWRVTRIVASATPLGDVPVPRLKALRAHLAAVVKDDKLPNHGASTYERLFLAMKEIPEPLKAPSYLKAHTEALSQLKDKYGKVPGPKVGQLFNRIKGEYDRALAVLYRQVEVNKSDPFGDRTRWNPAANRFEVIQQGAKNRIRDLIEAENLTEKELTGLGLMALEIHPSPKSREKWSRPIFLAVAPWKAGQPDLLREYGELYNQAYMDLEGVGEPAQPKPQTQRLLEQKAPVPSKVVEAAKEVTKKVEEKPATFAAGVLPIPSGAPAVLRWAAGEKGKVNRKILDIAEQYPEMIKYFDGIARWEIGKDTPETISEAQQVLRKLEQYGKEGRKAGWWARTMRQAKRVGELNATRILTYQVGKTEAGKPVYEPLKIFEWGRRQIGAALSRVEAHRSNRQEPFLKGTSTQKGLGALGDLGSYETMVEAGEVLTQCLEGKIGEDEIPSKYAANTNFTDPYKRCRKELNDRRAKMGTWERNEAKIAEIEAKGPAYGSYVTLELGPKRKETRFLVYGEANRVGHRAFQIRKQLKENYVFDENGEKLFYEFQPNIPRDGDYVPHLWESPRDFRLGWGIMMQQALAPIAEKHGEDSPQYKAREEKLLDQFREALSGFRVDGAHSLYGQSRYFANFQHRRANIPNYSKDPFFYMVRYMEGFDKKVELDRMVVEAWKNREEMRKAGESKEVIEIFDRLVNDALGRPSKVDLWALKSWIGKVLTKVGIPIDQQRPFLQAAYWEGWWRFNQFIAYRPITAAVNLGQARNTVLYEGVKAFRNALGASKRGTLYQIGTDKEGNPTYGTVPEIVMKYSGVFDQMTRSEIQDVLKWVKKGEFGYEARRLLPKALGGHKAESIISFEALGKVMNKCRITLDGWGQRMFNWSERKTRAWAWATGYVAKRDMGLDHRAAVRYGRELVERDIFLFNVVGRSAFMNSNVGKVIGRYTIYPVGQNLWMWRTVREFAKNPSDRKAAGRIVRVIACEGLIRMLKMIPFIAITIHDRWGDEALENWYRVYKAFVLGDERELNYLITRNPFIGASPSEVIGLLVGLAGWPGPAMVTKAPAALRMAKKLPYGQAIGMLYDVSQNVWGAFAKHLVGVRAKRKGPEPKPERWY